MPRKSAAPASTPKTPQPRQKPDWEAIERDYRTGKFTLRELEAKHGVNNAQIARKKKDLGWTQDLSTAIRQATSAKLIEEYVSKEVSSNQQAVSNTVLAAAEVNKQVILNHRTDLRGARDVAVSLMQELADAALLAQNKDLLAEILAGEGATPVDVNQARQVVNKALSVNTRISSIKALAEAFTKLQTAERMAFGIDQESPDNTPDSEKHSFEVVFVGNKP